MEPIRAFGKAAASYRRQCFAPAYFGQQSRALADQQASYKRETAQREWDGDGKQWDRR